MRFSQPIRPTGEATGARRNKGLIDMSLQNLYTVHLQISLCREDCKDLVSSPLRDAAMRAWSKMLFDRMKFALASEAVLEDRLPSLSEVLFSESISLLHVRDWQRGVDIVKGEIESLGLLADSKIGWLDAAEGVMRPYYPADRPPVPARTLLETLKRRAPSKESLKSLKVLLSSIGKKAKSAA
jgi:hypothetical protein